MPAQAMTPRVRDRRGREPLTSIPDLPRALRRLLAQVPAGHVVTYGGLAEGLGNVRAARWVATYLARHPHSSKCNCHRVVRKDGSLGQYVSGRLEDKAALLQHEGVAVRGGCVDLTACGPVSLTGAAPLAA